MLGSMIASIAHTLWSGHLITSSLPNWVPIHLSRSLSSMPNLLLAPSSALPGLVPKSSILIPFHFYKSVANDSFLRLQLFFSSMVSGVAEVLPIVDSDLKKMAARIIGKAKEICISKSVLTTSCNQLIP